ncbi:MAG: class I SAM-dependent methyltransferase [Victivallales bacterium]|nr:class I SAM-dependent methyltransferase [Victivallales bacterium]
MNCRFCDAEASLPFVDLVNAPPSNSYLTTAQLDEPESYFPLKVFVCEQCWLVQVDEYKQSDEIFDAHYAYFSSFSSSWLRHSREYVQAMTDRLRLGADSFVVEVAANDGYLLQYFNQAGIPCLGVEPTASTATAAREKGVDTVEEFFGADFARRLVDERGQADLMLGNNVLAHVPDINDFVEGFRVALAPGGTLTFEFPHLLNLIRHNQFDTIYHEHFSYLSLTTVRAILAAHGLTVHGVQELPTHGGSLRVFARHAANGDLPVAPAVNALEQREIEAGLHTADGYRGLQQATNAIRADFLRFLYDCRAAGKRVAAYGAAAKGNTLLNYCGIKGNELIEYVVDRSPHKQGLFLPGSHLPIMAEEKLRQTRPELIVILPWNLRAEIAEQLAYAREWDAKFAVCIPKLEVF